MLIVVWMIWTRPHVYKYLSVVSILRFTFAQVSSLTHHLHGSGFGFPPLFGFDVGFSLCTLHQNNFMGRCVWQSLEVNPQLYFHKMVDLSVLFLLLMNDPVFTLTCDWNGYDFIVPALVGFFHR